MRRPSETDGNIDSPFPAAVINVAAVCSATRSLGPGLRAVVWVQGCAFACSGCIAPGWIPIRPARLVTPETLVHELLANPDVSGLTFSGGEPMLQAAGLARLAHLARAIRSIDIICFSGYQRAVLETTPPGPGVDDLLGMIDVLIDGPYVQRLNDNHGLRGSSNQRVHHLTDRLRGYNLETSQRQSEVRVDEGQAFLIGVPPAGFGDAFHQALDLANQRRLDLLKDPVVPATLYGSSR